LERNNYGDNLYKYTQILLTIVDAVTHSVTTNRKSDDDYSSDVVTICLTDNCKDCTGSYSNQILRHRLICKCRCHRKETF
jgi:hypothetical protein